MNYIFINRSQSAGKKTSIKIKTRIQKSFEALESKKEKDLISLRILNYVAIFDIPVLEKSDSSVGQNILDLSEKEHSKDIRDEYLNSNREDILNGLPKNIPTFNDHNLRSRVDYWDSINQEPKGDDNNF